MPKSFNTILEEANTELDALGAKPIPYTPEEFEPTIDTEFYANSMADAIAKRDKDSLQVDLVSQEYAQEILDDGGKLFMARDGSAGAYVKGDGYMGGLFKDPTAGRSHASKVLQNLRREEGGHFFDAYATHLEDIYVKNGFRPMSRLEFDENQAPEGWENSNLKTKPDVVFFRDERDGDYQVGDGERIDDYMVGYDQAKG